MGCLQKNRKKVEGLKRAGSEEGSVEGNDDAPHGKALIFS